MEKKGAERSGGNDFRWRRWWSMCRRGAVGELLGQGSENERERECLCLDNKLLQLIYSLAGRAGGWDCWLCCWSQCPYAMKGHRFPRWGMYHIGTMASSWLIAPIKKCKMHCLCVEGYICICIVVLLLDLSLDFLTKRFMVNTQGHIISYILVFMVRERIEL